MLATRAVNTLHLRTSLDVRPGLSSLFAELPDRTSSAFEDVFLPSRQTAKACSIRVKSRVEAAVTFAVGPTAYSMPLEGNTSKRVMITIEHLMGSLLTLVKQRSRLTMSPEAPVPPASACVNFSGSSPATPNKLPGKDTRARQVFRQCELYRSLIAVK